MNPILLDMSENVVVALISGGVGIITSLVGAIGAFHASMKKSGAQQRDDIKAELIKYHEKNREEIKDIRQNDLREIRDDVTQMGASLQQKISLIELQLNHTREDISVLSNRVEKHNGIVERTYRLEDNDKLLDERIKVANHRIDDLERKS